MPKHCKSCGKPSGAFNYCRNHRRANAAKARARRSSSSARAQRFGASLPTVGYGNLTSAASFPVASSAYYDHPQTAPISSASEVSPSANRINPK